MIALAHALPAVTILTDKTLLYVASCPLDLAGVEAFLGGPLEVVQLDADTFLLTNGQAREQLLGKNLEASKVWFDRHTESGQGADFIHGPVILCRRELIAHFNHLHAVVKPILSQAERALNRRVSAQRGPEQEEAVLVCELGADCTSCGS